MSASKVVGPDPSSWKWFSYTWPEFYSALDIKAINDIVESQHYDIEPHSFAARYNDGSIVKNISTVKMTSYSKLKTYLEPLMTYALYVGRRDIGYDLYDTYPNQDIFHNLYNSDSKDSYDWHTDASAQPTTDCKFTLLINLSEENYTGGEFKYWPQSEEEYVDELTKPGTAFMFKSHIHHKVEPVTSGVRKSMSIFLHGPRFR